MNKKPILLRSLFALLVLFVFLYSMFPLTQRDFYSTFEDLLKDRQNPEVQKVVAFAKEKQAKDKGLYASSALEEAAREKGVSLIPYVKDRIVKSQSMSNNRDVIALVRKNMAGSIRLGIDLNGGAEFLLELEVNDQDGAKGEAKTRDIESNFDRYRDIAIETLRKRLETQNIFETEISPAGGKFISLRVPVVSREEKVRLEKLIKMSARLKFCLVHRDNEELAAAYLANPEGFQVPDGYRVMENTESRRGEAPKRRIYIVEREVQMGGKDITDAFTTLDQFGQREIILHFNPDGAAKFGEVTRNNVKRAMAIILDDVLYSAPTIQNAIEEGQAKITGDFSKEEAETISNALVSGSMPFKIKVEAQFDIDPTIGAETVRDGIYSGVAGTILVMIFMGIYYMRAGLVANISLVVNSLLILGAMAAFDITLTLPGIAGIILTIGMAVDANVLIYERIREELAGNKTVANAIDIGFSRAFSAIFDSNLTTLFVALILMWQGTGAIKGFAITLAIGIFTTMFTAVFLTQLLFDLMTRYTAFKTLRMRQFIGVTDIDFLGYRNIACGLSIVLIIAIFAFAGVKGKDILGVDFTGGTQLELNYEKGVPADKIATVLDKAGFETKVTYKTAGAAGGKRKLEVLLREKKGGALPALGANADDKMSGVCKLLNESFPDAKFIGDKQSTLGALIGYEFTKSAIISLVLAVVGMIIYMTIRFEFSYSIAANIALIHDAIIATGIYLMLGGQLTLQVVAAILTIIGYSVNDTIVTFDRLRENLTLVKGKTYREHINLSVNQTLGRTILTATTVFLVLLMQLVFGGVGIRDFVTVMLIGVVVGTYSSIYIAGPVVEIWHKSAGPNVKEERKAS